MFEAHAVFGEGLGGGRGDESAWVDRDSSRDSATTGELRAVQAGRPLGTRRRFGTGRRTGSRVTETPWKRSFQGDNHRWGNPGCKANRPYGRITWKLEMGRGNDW